MLILLFIIDIRLKSGKSFLNIVYFIIVVDEKTRILDGKFKENSIKSKHILEKNVREREIREQRRKVRQIHS